MIWLGLALVLPICLTGEQPAAVVRLEELHMADRMQLPL